VGWPTPKLVERARQLRMMSPEERARSIDEKRRLQILGLCTQCKVEPRSSTMTICKKCNCERRKKDAKIDARKAKLKKAEAYGGRCVRCQSLLTSPLTRRGKIRYLCDKCRNWVWDEYRRTHAERPYYTIHMLIMKFREEHGILPDKVWRTAPKQNSWSIR
jgi:hypothetical protein